MNDHLAWYVVKTVTTDKKGRDPVYFPDLALAEAHAQKVRLNTDVLSATVYRSAWPVKIRKQFGSVERPNVQDQASFERYGRAYIVYAPTHGDNHSLDFEDIGTRDEPMGPCPHRFPKAHDPAHAAHTCFVCHPSAIDILSVEAHDAHPRPRHFTPFRSDAQKSAWAKANPQCFPFHPITQGVNL